MPCCRSLPPASAGTQANEYVNLAFTYSGLVQLQLPLASLLSFPLEFQQGMKARGDILFDTGKNAPEHWDPVWNEGRVHAWLAVNAQTPEALDDCLRGAGAENDGHGRRKNTPGAGCVRDLRRWQGIHARALRIYRRLRQPRFQGRGARVRTRARQVECPWSLGSVGYRRIPARLRR